MDTRAKVASIRHNAPRARRRHAPSLAPRMRHGMTSTSVTTRRGFRARANAPAANDREREGAEGRGLFDDVYDEYALDEDDALEADESDEDDETWDDDRARLRGRRATSSSVEDFRAASFKREDARSTLQCGRASAIASVVLLFLGFSSIGRASTYSEQSERAKSEYSRAVDEWTSSRRAEFASAQFDFALAPVGAGDDWPTSTTAWKPTREVTTGSREGVDLRNAITKRYVSRWMAATYSRQSLYRNLCKLVCSKRATFRAYKSSSIRAKKCDRTVEITTIRP